MLNIENLEQFAKLKQTDVENAVREYFQHLFLSYFYKQPEADDIYFKGGTALRVVYGSPRFSEDLDFSQLSPVSFNYFSQIIKKVVAKYPEMTIVDLFNMPQTLFAKIIVSVNQLKVGIKIEVSKRKEIWHEGKDYQLKLLQSPASPLTPLIFVANLTKIYQDKIQATRSRRKPRDWFDLWFLSQKLDKPWNRKISLPKKLMLDRVRFLLPKSKRLILEKFDYEN